MKTILFLAILMISTAALSHGEHPKPIAQCSAKCTKEEIQKSVTAAIGKLILKGAIEKEWSSGKVEALELKTFKKGPEWVATVLNIKNIKHPRLYVFITTDGFLNGSNYTGN